MWLFPTAAGAVSGAFAATLARTWEERRRPNLLVWTVALAMFALASLAAAAGMLFGWSETSFRLYYLFGAIVNVPWLAAGTLYLLGPRRVAHGCMAVVGIVSVVAAVAVFSTDLHTAALETNGIPSGREVVSGGIRTLSRYYSYAGFLVVTGGAVWSAWRLARGKTEQLRRLATANVLIASGTVVVALGGALARRGQGSVFAVSLLVGVGLMFVGFLRTRGRSST